MRNWLRSPSKSAEWLWDAARFGLGVRETLDLPHAISIVCHPRMRRVAYRAQVLDLEQRAEFETFASFCYDKMVLFDVGAHFGVFSLAAAHFGGTAVAVDPSPIATRMIATQAALNGWSNRIQVLRAAVTDKDGSIDMLSSGVFSDGYFKVSKGRLPQDLVSISAITIDQMTQQFGAPSHIKVDVEGHEAAVLRGARVTMDRLSPLLFLELHTAMIQGEGGNPAEALDLLEEDGYGIFGTDGAPIHRAAILGVSHSRIMARRDRAR
jgi:FkbM family methyltransferase